MLLHRELVNIVELLSEKSSRQEIAGREFVVNTCVNFVNFFYGWVRGERIRGSQHPHPYILKKFTKFTGSHYRQLLHVVKGCSCYV